jgi:hypothetical protein
MFDQTVCAIFEHQVEIRSLTQADRIPIASETMGLKWFECDLKYGPQIVGMF